MIAEWSDEFNPFNSWKILMVRDRLEAIARGEFLPPVTCDTDLTTRCDLACVWCNSEKYRAGKSHDWSMDHARKMADFYAEWGIQSTCVAGGGESTLNPCCGEFIERVHRNGLEVGVISNALHWSDEIIDVLARVPRYVGVSLDAGDPETYAACKRTAPQGFDRVLDNLRKLCKLHTGGIRDITVKFLIHPMNYKSVARATRLTKEVGCHAIHIRPVGLVNLQNAQYDHLANFDFADYYSELDKLLTEARNEETPTFKVYAPHRQKFSPSMGKIVRFRRCLATPLHIVFGADGWSYLCFNLRAYPNAKMVTHDPDPGTVRRYWGSPEHKELIAQIDPVNVCPRCTFSHYQLVIERMILEDRCYWKFL